MVHRSTNKAGVALIKEFEGLRLEAYDDAEPNRKLTRDTPRSSIKGTLTIGIGHTGPDVYPGQKITEATALDLFDTDNDEAEGDVVMAVGDQALSDNQFAACVSLAYNIGGRAFHNSTVAKCLRRGDYTGAANAFKRWNKVRDANGKLVVSAGLTRRRAAEVALFLTPDHEGQQELIPRERPTTTPAEVVEAPAEKDIVQATIAKVTGVTAVAAGGWKAVEDTGIGAIPLYVLGGIAVTAAAFLLRKQIKKWIVG